MLNKVMPVVIIGYLDKHSEVDNYAVTDPDLSFYGVEGDVLDVFRHILKSS